MLLNSSVSNWSGWVSSGGKWKCCGQAIRIFSVNNVLAKTRMAKECASTVLLLQERKKIVIEAVTQVKQILLHEMEAK